VGRGELDPFETQYLVMRDVQPYNSHFELRVDEEEFGEYLILLSYLE
jgi:hypothetical protein